MKNQAMLGVVEILLDVFGGKTTKPCECCNEPTDDDLVKCDRCMIPMCEACRNEGRHGLCANCADEMGA